MIKYIRKYRKQTLAVAGVLLMITFVANIGQGNQSDGRQGDRVVAKITGGEIRIADLVRAKDELEFLRMTADETGQPTMAAQFAQALSPRVFAVLLKEAQQAGSRIPEDMLNGQLKALGIDPAAGGRRLIELHVSAVHNFLMVLQNWSRVGDAAKISTLMTLHEAADQGQEIALGAVIFQGSSAATQPVANAVTPTTAEAATRPATTQALVDETRPPTDEEIAHFNQYRESDSRSADPKSNSFGFGYKYPDRARIQYITVSPSAIENQIDVPYIAILRYYREHKSEFTVTPPASAPAATSTSQPATGPATAPVAAASTQPTTKPIEQVKDEIRDRLRAKLAKQIAAQMVRDITVRLGEDWGNYRVSGGATAKSAMGAAYTSYDYLQKLAEWVQKTYAERYPSIYREEFRPESDDTPKPFMVLPTVVDTGRVMSAEDLAEKPDLKNAYSSRTFEALPDAVLRHAEPLMSEAQRKASRDPRSQPLALFQPSPQFQSAPAMGGEGGVTVYRLIEVSAAHAPEKIDEVLGKVRLDLKKKADYARSLDQAKAFLTKATAVKSVQSAANEANLAMKEIGPFNRAQAMFDAIPGYTLSADSQRVFATEAFKLLEQRLRTGEEHPVGLIELPRAGAVLVAELSKFEPMRKDDMFLFRYLQAQEQAQRQSTTILMQNWFNPAGIAARTGFKPEPKEAELTDPAN